MSSVTCTTPSLFSPLNLSKWTADMELSLNDVFLSDGEDCVVFQHHEITMQAFTAMSELRRSKLLCDVTLTIGETSFFAHKIVLAASVPYFYAMFTNGMLESTQSNISICVEQVEADAMESIINFAYSGKVSISGSNVQNLLLAASFLQVNPIYEACVEFLRARLNCFNVLGIRNFGRNLSCSSLVTACDRFTEKFFEEVSQGEEFLNLGAEMVCDIISQDNLNVSSEVCVFEAVIRWVKLDIQNRSAHLPNLLSFVRLCFLPPSYLSDHVATEPVIKNCLRCRDLLDEARDFHLMPERRSRLQNARTMPRKCQADIVGRIYAVGGQTKTGSSISTVEFYDPLSGNWRIAEDMLMLRSRVGVGILLGKLYAIGGYNGSNRLDTVEVFDSSMAKWSRVASMSCKRSAVAACSVSDRLYVFGGYDGTTSLATVEFYDPWNDLWHFASSMSKQRSAAGVAEVGGLVYAIGGHNGMSIFDSVERYDPLTDTWEFLQSMQTKRCRLGVTAFQGKIYACGGYDGNSFLNSVEVYDPSTNRWLYIAPMNITRSRVALVSNMGYLWAIGGYDGTRNLPTVEKYCSKSNQWILVASMVAHEGGVGVGVIPWNS